LASVTFEYTQGGLYSSTTTTVRGDGTATRVSRSPLRPEESHAFSIDPKKVFELLDFCYRKRFFELKDHGYGPPNFPRLLPDGTVEVLATVVADGGGRTIKVSIGDYSKMVGYSDYSDVPVLVELARRITELPSVTVPK
jgi:hypothetical protein